MIIYVYTYTFVVKIMRQKLIPIRSSGLFSDLIDDKSEQSILEKIQYMIILNRLNPGCLEISMNDKSYMNNQPIHLDKTGVNLGL